MFNIGTRRAEVKEAKMILENGNKDVILRIGNHQPLP